MGPRGLAQVCPKALAGMDSWNIALTAEYPAAAAAGQDPAVLAELLRGEKIFGRKMWDTVTARL